MTYCKKIYGTTDPYEISGNFLFHTSFCFTYFVFCVFVSLTAVRISRSVYFFTSSVLLIQVYLRSGNSQRLGAVVFPVYKLCMTYWNLKSLHPRETGSMNLKVRFRPSVSARCDVIQDGFRPVWLKLCLPQRTACKLFDFETSLFHVRPKSMACV